MQAKHRSESIVRVLVAFMMTAVMASTAVLGDPGTAKAGQPLRGLRSWLTLESRFAAPFQPFMDALAGTQAINYGNDGRLTVLLLGSDTRTGGISRTDTIMIMSLKGSQINVASIPRDTARIPKPFGGGNYKGKINSLARQMGLASFEVVIERLLNIEIDYYALVSFRGFDALVDVVDPINVNIASPIKDGRYWDDPTSQGIYFPAATNYSLFSNPGAPACSGRWKRYTTPPQWTWCHHALVYVRSRKGGTDFQRARRQQNFVGAAIRTVNLADVAGLVGVANAQAGAGALMTDIPFNSSALALFNSLNGAYLANQVVFSPKAYATHIPGTTAFQLKLTAVRAWAAKFLN